MRQYSAQDLDDLAQGACILASGGGGPITMKAPLLQILAGMPAPNLAELSEVPDTAQVMVLIGIGMPSSVTVETITPLADAVTSALQAAVKHYGKIDYVCFGEIGIANTLLPMIACAKTGIPGVDAAGGQRSIPSFSMCVFASLPIAPIFLVGTQHGLVTLGVMNTADGERVAMGLVSSSTSGEMFGVALWPMSGKTAKAVASGGAVEYARQLGVALRQAGTNAPVDAVVNYMDGEVLFEGKISAFQTQAAAGFDINITVLDNGADEKFSVYSVNESLMAWSSKGAAPVAMGPDLICYLTQDGQVFTNADAAGIRAAGKTVAIIGAHAPADLMAPAILNAFMAAERQLGYGGPFTPLEVLKAIRTPQPARLVYPPATEGPVKVVQRWRAAKV